jgi:PDZ domain-containing secreted protein
VLFITVVVALAVASRINLNYYAIQPGTAQSVQHFITVPADKLHPVIHPVLLTDVEEGRVTALSYLVYKLQSDTALYPLDSVTGGTPPSQLYAQGNLEMSQAESDAKTAALRSLGYPVKATAAGAVIFGTFPGTPAYPVLNVGDVITAVDGAATTTAQELTTTLAHYHSGEAVTLSVRRGGTGTATPVTVTLKRTVVNLGGGQTATLNLGIEPEDQVDFSYPFPVNINVTNIGGPYHRRHRHHRQPGERGRRGWRPPKDRGGGERGCLDLPRPVAGVQGCAVQGSARSEDLRGLDTAPGPGRAGRPRWLGAGDVEGRLHCCCGMTRIEARPS